MLNKSSRDGSKLAKIADWWGSAITIHKHNSMHHTFAVISHDVLHYNIYDKWSCLHTLNVVHVLNWQTEAPY